MSILTGRVLQEMRPDGKKIIGFLVRSNPVMPVTDCCSVIKGRSVLQAKNSVLLPLPKRHP